MANKLNGFLDNFFGGVTNPKGNLGDFQHAQRLYVDNALRLAPKTKFLSFVNFTINAEALRDLPKLDNAHLAELNMLVKSFDMPQYRASVDVKNQYNRKKNVQTKLEYQPVTLTMHDDNFGITTMLMEGYYRYYYKDSNITNIESSYDPRSTYKAANGRGYRFGLDNDKTVPFFRNIKLYQFSRHEYTEYTLVNPIISQWGHDSMDQTDGTGLAENKMVVEYEAVLYNRGAIGEDSPATFASSHYDQTPSPLSIEGGGVANLFGGGGVLDGASDTLGKIQKGDIFGALISGANTIRNAKDLTFDSIKNEGLSILTGAVVDAVRDPGGVPNINFAKNKGNGGSEQVTEATAPEDTGTTEQRAAKVAAARAANSATSFPAADALPPTF
jgi:hypothetical protein